MNSEPKFRFWKDLMKSVHKNLHQYLKINLKDINLKKEEVHFLHFICNEKVITQNELTKIFCVNKSTTTRKVKKLIKEGYITRSKNPDDHREYILKATSKGTELSNYIKEIFKKWNFELTKNLNDEEIFQFKKISQKIIKNSDEFIERIKLNEQK